MEIENKENKIKNNKILRIRKLKHLALAILVLALAFIIFFIAPAILSSKYSAVVRFTADNPKEVEVQIPKFIATHVETPNPLKGVYMTSWVAGTPSIRSGVINLIEESELNAVVIDIKDDTGKISFDVWDVELDEIGAEEIRIADLREFIAELHSKGIYVIGRVSAFQDPYIVNLRPELAVKRSSDKEVWKDYKGISWIDAGSRFMWEYLSLIGKEAYDAGFDEINYDYIRFPSDGNMNDIFYPFSEDAILADPDFGKAEIIEEFFKYLSTELGESDVVLSADLFGMVTTNSDDLNIGQVLERALPYFDYVAPMVYPSHYPTGFIGITNPASYPYEVVDYSMKEAVKKIEKLKLSTTTPEWIRERVHKGQIRPWLQDFNLGAIYTPSMIRAQIQATYDNNLTSWVLWNASNTYTRDALLTE